MQYWEDIELGTAHREMCTYEPANIEVGKLTARREAGEVKYGLLRHPTGRWIFFTIRR